MRSRIATAATVALATGALTVSAAAAGNPHGVPPGQQEASGSAAAAASTKVNVGAKTHGKAQAKAAVAARAAAKTHGHAASAVKTNGIHAQASANTGVKPSSLTSQAGHNTVALASSNSTKLYGNGKTAGQIATQAGFGSAKLFGPGNSQPHKVICGVHNVDVHALKAHAAACTTAGAAVGAGAQASVAAQAPTVAAKSAAAAAGVKGAVKSAKPKKATHGGGVLGATAQLANATKPLSRAVLATLRKGTLPFTGLGLWLPVALGLVLIAGGYGLRRRARILS